jgi:hypothetical protein
MTIWYILCSFGPFFPVLVSCTKKNLATLYSFSHASDNIYYPAIRGSALNTLGKNIKWTILLIFNNDSKGGGRIFKSK